QLNATGANTYVWDSHPTFLSPSNVANTFEKPIAATTYQIEGTNTTTGCKNSASVTVTLNRLPTIDAGMDTSLCIGDSLQLNASGGTTYIWSNSSSLSNRLIANPWTFTTSTITYHLDAYDANGCYGQDDVTITVNPIPAAPFITEIGQWLV